MGNSLEVLRSFINPTQIFTARTRSRLRCCIPIVISRTSRTLLRCVEGGGRGAVAYAATVRREKASEKVVPSFTRSTGAMGSVAGAMVGALLFGIALLAGCVVDGTRALTVSSAVKPRWVPSGERRVIDFVHLLGPECEIKGYPEVRVVRGASHGSVSSDHGENYPNFARDDVRYECNRHLVRGTEVLYQSKPGFHGKDSFTIEVRFSADQTESASYTVEVR
jgi:hypothetical protein